MPLTYDREELIQLCEHVWTHVTIYIFNCNIVRFWFVLNQDHNNLPKFDQPPCILHGFAVVSSWFILTGTSCLKFFKIIFYFHLILQCHWKQCLQTLQRVSQFNLEKLSRNLFFLGCNNFKIVSVQQGTISLGPALSFKWSDIIILIHYNILLHLYQVNKYVTCIMCLWLQSADNNRVFQGASTTGNSKVVKKCSTQINVAFLPWILMGFVRTV